MTALGMVPIIVKDGLNGIRGKSCCVNCGCQ
jgi:hypothetical protein